MAEQSESAARPLSVTVVRSGGFAGLTRSWRVAVSASDSAFWADLVEKCPWDPGESRSPAAPATPTAPASPRGADRFAWRVAAACGDGERAADLAEDEVDGPWRALIDAVRAASASAAAAAAEQ